MLQNNHHIQIRNVYLCDKHPLICEGLKTVLLNTEPTLNVIPVKNYETEYYKLPVDINRDDCILILDIFSMGKDFVERLVELKQEVPPTRLVIFSEINNDRLLRMLHLLGVQNIIEKNTPIVTIKQAFKYLLLAHDATYNMKVNNVSISKPEVLHNSHEEQFRPFSKQEVICLKYLKLGMTNSEISKRLGIAESTAKSHVSSIINKMKLVNRTAVVSVYHSIYRSF